MGTQFRSEYQHYKLNVVYVYNMFIVIPIIYDISNTCVSFIYIFFLINLI